MCEVFKLAVDACNLVLPTCQPLPSRFSYPHDGGNAAIIGGTVYNGTAFPAAYQGAYFTGTTAETR